VSRVSARSGAGISWMKENLKDVLMTAFTFLGLSITLEFDHHFNRPSA
jgi:hypothetical protein